MSRKGDEHKQKTAAVFSCVLVSTDKMMNCGSSGLYFQVVYDRVTDRSRGFAFVTMGSAEEAKEAIRMLDGSVSCTEDYNYHLFWTLPSN